MPESFSAVDLPESMAPPPLLSLPGGMRNWALFLDFDGTLVELAATPETIVVPPHLSALLMDLYALFGGALAVLTGRSLSDLDHHLTARLPASGQHGAEWRPEPDSPPVRRAVPALDAVRHRVAELTATYPGLLVEDKGATLAVHYRGAPDAGPRVHALLEELAAGSAGALEVVAGKRVCEVRPVGVNKGAALADFLRIPPFAGRRPLVLGDDVTDEAGFAVALGAGGSAIKVGVGASRAPWRLGAPSGVRAWLAQALEANA